MSSKVVIYQKIVIIKVKERILIKNFIIFISKRFTEDQNGFQIRNLLHQREFYLLFGTITGIHFCYR